MLGYPPAEQAMYFKRGSYTHLGRTYLNFPIAVKTWGKGVVY